MTTKRKIGLTPSKNIFKHHASKAVTPSNIGTNMHLKVIHDYQLWRSNIYQRRVSNIAFFFFKSLIFIQLLLSTASKLFQHRGTSSANSATPSRTIPLVPPASSTTGADTKISLPTRNSNNICERVGLEGQNDVRERDRLTIQSTYSR